MHVSTLLITTATLFFSLVAAANVIVEKRDAPPSSWKRSNIPLDASSIIPLRIGMRQSNLHHIEGTSPDPGILLSYEPAPSNSSISSDELLAVSDPSSTSYGKHWTPARLASFFEPAPSTVRAVQNWLEEAGLGEKVSVSKGNLWVEVRVTVEEAERLLETRYEMYEHRNGESRLACESYSVPQNVRHFIDIITPTLHFDVPEGKGDASKSVQHEKRVQQGKAKQVGEAGQGLGPKLSKLGFAGAYQAVAAAGQLGNCANVTTLACLSALYNYTGYAQKATHLNSYGIVEYQPNSYAPQDLDGFFTMYAPKLVGLRPKLYSIDGGFITPVASNFEVNGESDLDLEYAMPIVSPLVPTLYQVGVQGSFNNFLDALDGSYCTSNGGDDPTQDGPYAKVPGVNACGGAPFSAVISTSYGYNEADLTPAYEKRQCNEYAKLGLLGTTFLFSSGDNGVAGNMGDCLDPVSRQPVPAGGTVFAPAFPSSCPYIVSVGATQTKVGADVTKPGAEMACETVIYSGGGFSNVFAMPSYQKKAVSTYFKNHLPPYSSAQYNNSQQTRGHPDLSANGANYAVFYSGMSGLVYGTSASSPVVGGIITLINDARYAVRKGPVGFINPAIYSDAFAAGFNDITSGGNQGCGTPGFSAVTGWDPVTGLGTPNFKKLVALFLALP